MSGSSPEDLAVAFRSFPRRLEQALVGIRVAGLGSGDECLLGTILHPGVTMPQLF